MKKFLKDMKTFATYISIFGVLLAYSLFKKDGIVSVMLKKDLSFIFWAILVGLMGFVIGFIVDTFFVGSFFEKLRGSINSLTISLTTYIIVYNIGINISLYTVVKYFLLIIVTISFYGTLRELKINENITFEVFLKSVFCLCITIESYILFNFFYGKDIAKVFLCGYGVTQFFLMLSLLRYIPKVAFENFSKNLIIKYSIGCFIYIYLKFIRSRLTTNNFIYVVEWGLICIAFLVYFYNLIKNLRNMSYKSYESVWGKHKQMRILIRNEEFSYLSGYIDLFVEKGEKTSLVEFLFNQLYKLKICDDDAKIIMYNLIEYKENDLPKYCSRYKMEHLKDQNKNSRFLVAKYTVEKLSKIIQKKG